MAINLVNNNSLANITALPSGISSGAMYLSLLIFTQLQIKLNHK